MQKQTESIVGANAPMENRSLKPPTNTCDLLRRAMSLMGRDAACAEDLWGRRFLVVLVAVFGILAATLPASAILNGWWAYDPSAGSLNSVTFQRCSLTSATLTAANWSDANNLEPLDMTTAIYSCNTGNNYAREVNIFDDDYGDTSWAGRWYCHYGQPYGGVMACEEGVIQIHTDHVNGSDPAYDKAVLCHEHGHSVGLAHNSISCMRNPATSASLYYAQAEKNELNNIY